MVSIAVLIASLVGCGAVGNKIVIEERNDGEAFIEAVRRSAVSMGYEPRYREGRQVNIVIDRESRTYAIFQVKRRGIVLATRTRGGDDVPVEDQQRWLRQADQVGRQIYQGAQAQFEAMERERAAAEARERTEAAARRREREANQAELADFMAQNNARREAHQNRVHGGGESGGANDPASAGGAGAAFRCCINGTAYACPNAGAVDQCSGRFMRCVQREGMSGMESCLQSDPPDPSACERNPSLDSEC